MTLLIESSDVEALFDYERIMSALEVGLHEERAGTLVMPPRSNLPMRDGHFRLMPVVLNGIGVMGFKVFYRVPVHGARHLVAVFEQERGELLALVDANHLTAARTGATSGVATKYLARADVTNVAVIGSGLEARTNLAAIMAVRPALASARVFSPRAERRELFATYCAETYGLAAVACERPEDALEGADVVIIGTNTTAHGGTVAYSGEWMRPGQHIVSVGSTMPSLRELDATAFAVADRVVIDAPEQAAYESGDVIAAIDSGTYHSDQVIWLKDLVGDPSVRRAGDAEITLYKSVGTAMQDVASAYALWQTARGSGRGRELGEITQVRPL